MPISDTPQPHAVVTPFRARVSSIDAEREKQLVSDALSTIGSRPAAAISDEQAAASTLLRQGATVRIEGTTWTVTGSAGDGAFELARQTRSGVERSTVDGAALLRANQHLVYGRGLDVPAGHPSMPAGHYLIDGDPGSPDVPFSAGTPRTSAPIKLVLDQPAGTAAPISTDLEHVLAIKPTLGKLTLAGPHDVLDAASLVALSSPRAIAVDGALALNPDKWLDGARVSATPTSGDPIARSIIKSVIETQDWLKSRHGVDVIDPENPLLVITNSQTDRLNASMMSEGGVLGVGPLSDSVGSHLNRLLHPQPLTSRQTLRFERQISTDLPFVLEHEVGHEITDHAWGVPTIPDLKGPSHAARKAQLARLESGTAREAVSDLTMAARSGKSRIAVRNLNSLKARFGDYHQFHNTVAANPGRVDVHDATQLITQPVATFAKTHGWDLAGELTMSMVNRVGDQIYRGELPAESFSGIADAFRHVTATRFGHDSPEFTSMAKAFARVKL